VRALVFANREDPELGVAGDWARDRGFEIDARARERLVGPADLSGYDLVVSLGSSWSVHSDHVRDPVTAERATLRAAVDATVPVLGICFGGQLLSGALGGAVARAPRPEIGWLAVETDDPSLVPPGPWMQWHVDRFTVPPGALELARTPDAVQAFRLGSALGLQFHPEADAPTIARWAASGRDELVTHGSSPAELVADTERHQARARVDAYRLFDAFWSRVAAR